MSRIPVIGLCGPRQVGKDTVRRFIIASQGGYPYSMADPIRAMLLGGFGIDMNDPYWIENKEQVIPALGKSPRDMMRTLGTEWGRDLVNQDIWLTLARQRLLAMGPGMVLADIRFENEAKWVRDMGGRIVHIDSKIHGQQDVQHSSDTPVIRELGDGIIVNNGSLEDLQSAVKDLLHIA